MIAVIVGLARRSIRRYWDIRLVPAVLLVGCGLYAGTAVVTAKVVGAANADVATAVRAIAWEKAQWIDLFMHSLAIALGISGLAAEARLGSITVILSRPIRRFELVCGHWLAGFVILLAAEFTRFALIAIPIFSNGGGISAPEVVAALAALAGEWETFGIFSAIAVVVSPWMAMPIGLTLHAIPVVYLFTESPLLRGVIRTMRYGCPLTVVQASDVLAGLTGAEPRLSPLVSILLHRIAYGLVALLVAAWVFEHQSIADR